MSQITYLNHYIIVDTSGDKNFLAYVNRQKLLKVFNIPRQPDMGEHVLAVLQQEALDLKSVCGLGVCVGPGWASATRSGISLALGLATSMNIPLVGFSALEGFLTARDVGVELLLPLNKKGGILVQSSEFSFLGACVHESMGMLGRIITYEEIQERQKRQKSCCLVAPCVQSVIERIPVNVNFSRKKRSLRIIRDLVISRLQSGVHFCSADYRNCGSSFFMTA